MFNRDEVYGCGMLMDIGNQDITAHSILIMGSKRFPQPWACSFSDHMISGYGIGNKMLCEMCY